MIDKCSEWKKILAAMPAQSALVVFRNACADLARDVDAIGRAAVADQLQTLADGYVDAGADAIQRIMATEFANAAEPEQISQQPRAAASTLRAAEYLIRQKDPERMRRWLEGRSPGECAAILRHIEKRKRGQAA